MSQRLPYCFTLYASYYITYFVKYLITLLKVFNKKYGKLFLPNQHIEQLTGNMWFLGEKLTSYYFYLENRKQCVIINNINSNF